MLGLMLAELCVVVKLTPAVLEGKEAGAALFAWVALSALLKRWALMIR